MQSLFLAIKGPLSDPITWCLFVLGALVGSFLNVCIFRIPAKTFFSHARSVCGGCGKVIPFYLNIPIVAWILLRGRAHCCGAKLSIQYPLVEAATGVLFAYLYWRYPFIETLRGSFALDPENFIRYVHFTLFSCLLLVCAVIDLRHQIIPDVISLPMIAATPIVVWLHPDLDWKSAAFGVVLGGGSLYVLAWAYYLLRREAGLGLGDVKLLAAIGGWLGYQSLLPTIFIASFTGAVFGIGAIIISRKMSLKSAVPFGPFLALGAFVNHLFGTELAEWLAK